MSSGKELEAFHKWIEPYIGRVTFAIVLRRISRSEILMVADKLEEGARWLRRIVGEKQNDDTE